MLSQQKKNRNLLRSNISSSSVIVKGVNLTIHFTVSLTAIVDETSRFDPRTIKKNEDGEQNFKQKGPTAAEKRTPKRARPANIDIPLSCYTPELNPEAAEQLEHAMEKTRGLPPIRTTRQMNTLERAGISSSDRITNLQRSLHELGGHPPRSGSLRRRFWPNTPRAAG